MRPMHSIKWPALIIYLILFQLASFAFSQPSDNMMRHGPEFRGWRGEGRCFRASELNLSQDQAKRLESIQQAYLRDTQVPRTELFSKRLELREFFTNPTVKIETIRSKYLEINELESRIEEKTIDYLLKVKGLLTQEQLKIWCPEQEFSLFRRMMQGPGYMAPSPQRRNPPFPFQERPGED
jgi:hypothetical protein